MLGTTRTHLFCFDFTRWPHRRILARQKRATTMACARTVFVYARRNTPGRNVVRIFLLCCCSRVSAHCFEHCGYSYTTLLFSLLVSFSFQQARPSLRAINTIGHRRHGANVPRIAARTAFVNEPCGAKTTKRNNGPWIQCVWARWKVLKIAIVLSAKALWVSVASFY